jgi:hypothetical protein
MPEWDGTPAELRGLDLGPDGAPQAPLITVDLDKAASWPDAELATAADALSRELAVTVGIGHSAPSPRLRPLSRALTLSLVPDGAQDDPYVLAGDVDRALAELHAAVRATPQSAVALAGLVRATGALDVQAGLLAEAAMYSTLLGGPEFRRWLSERSPPPPRPSETSVLAERNGNHLLVLLNRPQQRNAVDARMREALVDALLVAIADPAVAVIDLRGAGPSFCSGGDLSEFGQAADITAAFFVRIDRSPARLLYRLRARTQVHVHGACVGAGLEMAAFAESVAATPDATFRLPEVSMGLVPGAGGTVSVVRRIGRWRAAWMMITGALVPAGTALRWGLIDAVVDE